MSDTSLRAALDQLRGTLRERRLLIDQRVAQWPLPAAAPVPSPSPAEGDPPDDGMPFAEEEGP